MALISQFWAWCLVLLSCGHIADAFVAPLFIVGRHTHTRVTIGPLMAWENNQHLSSSDGFKRSIHFPRRYEGFRRSLHFPRRCDSLSQSQSSRDTSTEDHRRAHVFIRVAKLSFVTAALLLLCQALPSYASSEWPRYVVNRAISLTPKLTPQIRHRVAFWTLSAAICVTALRVLVRLRRGDNSNNFVIHREDAASQPDKHTQRKSSVTNAIAKQEQQRRTLRNDVRPSIRPSNGTDPWIAFRLAYEDDRQQDIEKEKERAERIELGKKWARASLQSTADALIRAEEMRQWQEEQDRRADNWVQNAMKVRTKGHDDDQVHDDQVQP